MPSKNILQVTEFEELYYDDATPFKQKHWEVLCRYAESVGKSSVNKFIPFRILNKGIQFTNYVGVLQAGNLTIEILPKTDRVTSDNDEGTSADTSKQQWQISLLQMLSECSLLPVHSIGNAYLNLRSGSILDVYLELFMDETERLLHQGLHKIYRQQEGNNTALKGQLLLHKQVQKNSVHKERFYVRHTAYDTDTIFNRIVGRTVQLIGNMSANPSLRSRANRLLVMLPLCSAINVTDDTFFHLTYDRKTERYREAMQLAKMLVLNYRPDITGGTENVMAILFDMNKLWEEWVYRRLKKEETNFDITILRQPSTNFWKGEHLPRHKTIRPDMVIKKGDEIFIVDTKWKITADRSPDDADLKQMFVYNLYWESTKSILLYPANDAQLTRGYYQNFGKTGVANNQCAVLTATIFKDGMLNKDFVKDILEKIFQL